MYTKTSKLCYLHQCKYKNNYHVVKRLSKQVNTQKCLLVQFQGTMKQTDWYILVDACKQRQNDDPITFF